MENLLVRNESIQHLFHLYCDNYFLVNRKYQRKLVWTLEEKQKFINSIASEYPVPLFLLAEAKDNNCEIIDGMQRLEAIFSFLRGEYILKFQSEEGYFDLTTLAETKSLLDSGTIFQNRPVLSKDLCIKIVSYQIPISITPFKDEQIEDIFRRINATGRQLSSQDLRQAGAVGDFCNIVRKISSEIRRDSSPNDVLLLSKMREISLSSKEINYGIDLNKVFWVKQQIITVNNMRLSRDEELISYLLIYILLGPDISPTAHNLDIIYGFEEEDPKLLRNKIIMAVKRDGEKNIITRFMSVFDEFERLLGRSSKSFSKLIFNDEAHGKGRSFQVVFLAFYNIVTKGNRLCDPDKLIQILSGIGEREFADISSDKWKAHYRNEKISALQGIINDCFTVADSHDPAVDNWISKLENILMQSKIEQQLFDFKIGLHNFKDNKPNKQCLSKIVKTLTAMANNHKNAVGYVLIGIADTEADAKKHATAYSTQPKEFNSFYIAGIDGEVASYYKSKDEYFNMIKQRIEAEPIEDYTKSYITRNMMMVNYYDKCIVVLSLKSDTKPLLYDNKFYERRAANNHLIEESEIQHTGMVDLFSRFN